MVCVISCAPPTTFGRHRSWSSRSRRRTGRATAVLELLAAAARTVVVAADSRGRVGLAGILRNVAHSAEQPFDLRRILGLVLFNAHDHLPTVFVTKSNDGFRSFNGPYADHGGPLMTSQLCQSSSVRSSACKNADSLSPTHRSDPSRRLAPGSPWPARGGLPGRASTRGR